MDADLLAVPDRDPGRLLAAVLEREEPEVGQVGDVDAGRVDAEDAAHQALPPPLRLRRRTSPPSGEEATRTMPHI